MSLLCDLNNTSAWILRSPPRDLSFLSRAWMGIKAIDHNRTTADLSSLCNCLDRTHRFLDDYEGPHVRPMEVDSRHGGRIWLWSVVNWGGLPGGHCSAKGMFRQDGHATADRSEETWWVKRKKKIRRRSKEAWEDRAASPQPSPSKTLIGPTAVVGGRDGGGRRCGCGGARTSSRAKLAEPSQPGHIVMVVSLFLFHQRRGVSSWSCC